MTIPPRISYGLLDSRTTPTSTATILTKPLTPSFAMSSAIPRCCVTAQSSLPVAVGSAPIVMGDLPPLVSTAASLGVKLMLTYRCFNNSTCHKMCCLDRGCRRLEDSNHHRVCCCLDRNTRPSLSKKYGHPVLHLWPQVNPLGLHILWVLINSYRVCSM